MPSIQHRGLNRSEIQDASTRKLPLAPPSVREGRPTEFDGVRNAVRPQSGLVGALSKMRSLRRTTVDCFAPRRGLSPHFLVDPVFPRKPRQQKPRAPLLSG